MSRKEYKWRLEAHCCRNCFARIVSRPIDDEDSDQQVYQCTNCGVEAVGHKPSVLCACGTKLQKPNGKSVDAGIRCHENKARTPEFPSVITASYAGAQAD